MHLVDTNVLLRHLIGDNPPKAARATALWERVEQAEEIVEIPEGVLTETVWTLDKFYQVPRQEIGQIHSSNLPFSGSFTWARGTKGCPFPTTQLEWGL